MLAPELLQFFKDNSKALPEITQAWFRVPNEAQAMLKALSREELLEKVKSGELNRWTPRPELEDVNLPEATSQVINDAIREVARLTERRRFLAAIRTARS